MSDLNPQVILGVAAHPDDLDFGAAGSLAKWAAAGAKVYYLILTNGSKGSSKATLDPPDLIARRRSEQRAAGKIIGLEDVFFADFEDGLLENTPQVRREIIRHIRMLRPDVVITWDPAFIYSASLGFINHPDHRAAGQATLDAVYPHARNHLIHPELASEGHMPHKVSTVLLMRVDEPNFICNISKYLATKIRALECHTSQFVPGCDEELLITSHAHKLGRAHGVLAAEGFMRIDLRF